MVEQYDKNYEKSKKDQEKKIHCCISLNCKEFEGRKILEFHVF